MTKRHDPDCALETFRLAARDLFNSAFRVHRPYDSEIAWSLRDRFLIVESALFGALVTRPMGFDEVPYGGVQPWISVAARPNLSPIQISIRKIGDSGYWEEPVELPANAELSFMKFFDWDQLEVRDNRYVWVSITKWPNRPDLTGREALVESLHVQFVRVPELKS